MAALRALSINNTTPQLAFIAMNLLRKHFRRKLKSWLAVSLGKYEYSLLSSIEISGKAAAKLKWKLQEIKWDFCAQFPLSVLAIKINEKKIKIKQNISFHIMRENIFGVAFSFAVYVLRRFFAVKLCAFFWDLPLPRFGQFLKVFGLILLKLMACVFFNTKYFAALSLKSFQVWKMFYIQSRLKLTCPKAGYLWLLLHGSTFPLSSSWYVN